MPDTPADIKLIVIDLDGTLLTPDKRITPGNKAAIAAAQERGIVVTIATGRRYANTAPIADELGLDLPIILCDGALIVEHPQQRVLLTRYMSAQVAQQAVDIFARHHVQPVVHHLKGIIEETWTGPIEFDNPWVQVYFTAFPEHLKRMPIETLCVGHPDPLRVVAFDSEEAINSMLPEIATLNCSWNAIKRGNYGSAEVAVMTPACSKASGIAALAESLGITMQQVMAIGDGNNDIEMLEMVGWGVAMQNAATSIQSLADAVTASNTEDGVARAIERYALRPLSRADSNSRRRKIWR